MARSLAFTLPHIILGFVLTVLTIVGIIASLVFSGFVSAGRTVVSGVVVIAEGTATAAGDIISTAAHAAEVAIADLGSTLASAGTVIFNLTSMLITRAAAALATLLQYFVAIAEVLVPKLTQLTTYILSEIAAYAIPLVQKILTAAAYLMLYILQVIFEILSSFIPV